MNKIFLIAILIISSLGICAKDQSQLNYFSQQNFSKHTFNAKPIDITVTVNGYTIHITGSVDYSIFTKKVTINCIISITGNGTNISLPFNYTGPLSKLNVEAALSYFPSDQEVADFVVSCINFNTMTIVYPNGQGS